MSAKDVLKSTHRMNDKERRNKINEKRSLLQWSKMQMHDEHENGDQKSLWAGWTNYPTPQRFLLNKKKEKKKRHTKKYVELCHLN